MNENFNIGFDFGLGVFVAAVVVVGTATGLTFCAYRIIQLIIDIRQERKDRKVRERRREDERLALDAAARRQAKKTTENPGILRVEGAIVERSVVDRWAEEQTNAHAAQNAAVVSRRVGAHRG